MLNRNWSGTSHYISHQGNGFLGEDYGAIWVSMTRLDPGTSFTYHATILFQEPSKAEYRVKIATGPGNFDLSVDSSDFTVVRTYDDLWTVMRVCW